MRIEKGLFEKCINKQTTFEQRTFNIHPRKLTWIPQNGGFLQNVSPASTILGNFRYLAALLNVGGGDIYSLTQKS